jgi:hypothetical protein
MKRILFGALAVAGTTAAMVAPSGAQAASPTPVVCGSMKPVDCVVYYLTRWDPCLLCGGEDAARRD